MYIKVALPDATIGQASLLFSSTCAFIVISTWPLFILANFTGFETIEWNTIPWEFMNLSSIFSLVVNGLIFFGTAITVPIFMAIGMLLSIPCNALVDLMFREMALDSLKICGMILIFFSFIILLIPVEKARRISRWMLPCCYKNTSM